MTPKALRSFILYVVLLLAFTSLLPADVLYTQAPYGGLSNLSVLGAQFTFPSYGQLVLAMCPDPTGDGPIPCSASSGSLWVSGVSSVGWYGYSADLYAGDAVGPSDPFLNSGLMLSVVDLPFAPYQVDGDWYHPGFNYLGFRVSSNDGYHYGWADLQIDGFIPEPYSPAGHFYVTIWDYAYESCPGQSIAAGQTSGGASCSDPSDPPDPTPEPATAIPLLVGLAGLAAYKHFLSA